MPDIEQHLRWSEWLPLERCIKGSPIPPRPGLYRIRRMGRGDLDYIGQTGRGRMNLRRRLAMLRGIYRAEMPYRDPHTAGPGLWALLREGVPFEVSFAAVEGTAPWRLGLEAVCIALYRQEHGVSPSLSFGRMPEGYSMSSVNGAMRRGSSAAEHLECHNPSLGPAGPLDGDPHAAGWGGYRWSAWAGLPLDADGPVARLAALYRIRDPLKEGLLYVGQGNIPARLRSHVRKGAASDDPRSLVFRGASSLEASWVATCAAKNQRLELENDLIAAHVLAIGTPPLAQFGGWGEVGDR